MTLEQQKAFGLNPLMSFRLAEAYIRKEPEICEQFVKSLHDLLTHKATEESTFLKWKKLGIGLEVIPGTGIVSGYFDLTKRTVVLLMTEDVLSDIASKDDEYLEKISKELWTHFTHEDTHRQQFDKMNVKLDYKNATSKYWNEDLGKDFDYFNQPVEADAYGREIASRLETMYPDKSVASIFLKINLNDIADDYTKKNNKRIQRP